VTPAAHGWRHDFVLTFLPVPGITPAVETGNHHNPVLLNLEEYSDRGSAALPDGEGCDRQQRIAMASRDCRNRGLDRKCKTFPQFGADVVIPCPRFKQVLVRLPVSRRPGVSRFLREAGPDLFPGDYIGRVLLVTGDTVVKL